MTTSLSAPTIPVRLLSSVAIVGRDNKPNYLRGDLCEVYVVDAIVVRADGLPPKSKKAHGLDNCLRIVVSSLCHVVRQVHLELEVSAVVGSTEQYAREVALPAYFFGFDDCRPICQVNVFRSYSLSAELRCHESWFSTICTSVHLGHVDQGLEVFHILCVGHVVGLVVRRHLMLCLLEGIGALLMVVEAAALPLDD
jgi:hypothetical protein